jgi:hypothetical protein
MSKKRFFSMALAVLIIASFFYASALSGKDTDNKDGTTVESSPPPNREIQKLGTLEAKKALGNKMDAMKQKADKAIEKAESSSRTSQAFQQGALEIMCAMRPEFGPANAWLFNERDNKIKALSEKLKLSHEDAASLWDPARYDAFCAHMEDLRDAAEYMGYEVTSSGSNRKDQLWSPAPGFAMQITDKSEKVEWRHPYSEGAKVKRHPRLTLFVFPPIKGKALRHFFTRHQPGGPFFYSGNLMAFTLQVPQSHDASPDEIKSQILPGIKKSSLVFVPPSEAVKALQSSKDRGVKSVKVKNGIITVEGARGARLPESKALMGCAVLWIEIKGSAEELTLLFP